MFCPKCGTNVTDGVKYCPNCGAPMNNGLPVNGMYGFSVPTDGALGTGTQTGSTQGFSAPINSASGYNSPGYGVSGYSAPPSMYGTPGYSTPPAMSGYPTNYAAPNPYGYVQGKEMNARQIVCLIFALISTIFVALSVFMPILQVQVIWEDVEVSTWSIVVLLVEIFKYMGTLKNFDLFGISIEMDPFIFVLMIIMVISVLICGLFCIISACKAPIRLMLGKERWYVAIPMQTATGLGIAHVLIYIGFWGVVMLKNWLATVAEGAFGIADILNISITPWGWIVIVVAIVNSAVFIKGYRD